MGETLLSRLIAQKIYSAAEILVSDASTERLTLLKDRYGVTATTENQAVATKAEVLLLAIKPQVFESVINQLSMLQSHTPVILSIMAGVPLQKLEAAFPICPVIRAMPNTPATVGAGMTAIAAGQQVKPHHLEQAQQIFSAVGEVIAVPESAMDAVTGLSGSGPGFVAVAIEALIDGGVSVGLSRAIATQLALQTVRGTAQLLQETGLHPAELKDRVTSPGGTTIAGVTALEQAGFRAALIQAVQAAYHRSQELGS